MAQQLCCRGMCKICSDMISYNEVTQTNVSSNLNYNGKIICEMGPKGWLFTLVGKGHFVTWLLSTRLLRCMNDLTWLWKESSVYTWMLSMLCYQKSIVLYEKFMLVNANKILLILVTSLLTPMKIISIIMTWLTSPCPINSLRPSDTYMCHWTNHHWFK